MLTTQATLRSAFNEKKFNAILKRNIYIFSSLKSVFKQKNIFKGEVPLQC